MRLLIHENSDMAVDDWECCLKLMTVHFCGIEAWHIRKVKHCQEITSGTSTKSCLLWMCCDKNSKKCWKLVRLSLYLLANVPCSALALVYALVSLCLPAHDKWFKLMLVMLLIFDNPDLLALVQSLYIPLSILMQVCLIPSALYMLELVNACTIPEKLVKHSTCTSQHIFRGSCISGGGSFQGEWPSWVLEIHTWWVPLSTRGRVYDSSSFACSVLGGVFPKGESFGDEWCEILKNFLLVTGGAECALIWLSVA